MRRLRALIQGLPDTSALRRTVRGDHHGWGSNEELLALNVELTHALLITTLKIHSKKGSRVPPPLHIPRPGEATHERRKPTRQDFRNLLLGG